MKKILTISLVTSLAVTTAMAGNDTKRGQAGATELLINPWSRSTGWNGANSGCVRGIESMNLNIGGLAYVRNTDFALSTQRYMSGSDISISTLGLATRLSPTGVLGVSVMSMSLGDFIETTYALPEGTGNTFKPQLFNFGIGYAKTFSSRITGGITIRGIYQGIANANAFGLAFDAGIQYQSGKNNEFKFGVAIRNVGPKMKYQGEGLSFKGQRDQIGLTLSNRVAPYELPALLNIGTGYDILLPSQELRITPAFNFTSNSYTKDDITPGIELAFKEMFMLRTSYNFQGSITSTSESTQALKGFAAGGTIDLPLAEMFGQTEADEMTSTALSEGAAIAPPAKTKSGISVGIDYSYRPTNPYNGTHSIGIVVRL